MKLEDGSDSVIDRSKGSSNSCPQARACERTTNIFGKRALPNPFSSATLSNYYDDST